ncbi:MAG: HAMP domain-containing protein [Candidatus Kerfeldbacteria bacterium]|nr:HAMP domain-containing protein [Candidatus Kerfeldbacteria bacterium]
MFPSTTVHHPPSSTLSAPQVSRQPLTGRQVIVRLASAAVSYLGLFTLIGWAGELETFKSVLPGTLPTNPLLAVSLIFLGGAMWLAEDRSRAELQRLSGVLSGTVVAVAILRLVAWLGLDLGIDQAIFPRAVSSYVPPIRIGIATAVGLLTGSTALAFLRLGHQRWLRPAQWLSFLTATLASLALIGHLYGVTAPVPIGLVSAVGLLIVGLGLLASDPLRQLPGLGLATKVSLAVGFFGLVSMAVASYSVYGKTIRDLEQSLGQQQEVAAANTMQKIDRLLEEALEDIELISTDNALVASLSSSPTDTDVSSRLSTLAGATGPWSMLSVVGSDFQLVSSTSPSFSSTSTALTTEGRRVLTSARLRLVSYSDVIPPTRQRSPTVILAAPVLATAPDRPLLGVAVGEIDWSGVTKTLRDVRDGTVQLYDRRGIMVATNDVGRQRLAWRANFRGHRAVDQALRGRVGSEIGSGLVPESIGQAPPTLAVGELTAGSEATSQQTLVSYVPQRGYLEYRGSGWALTLETKTGSVVTAALQTASQVALTTAVLVSLLIVSLLLVLRTFLHPVARLTAGARGLAAGNFAQRVAADTDDELGQLAAAFNTMATRLQELYRRLDDKVHRRTAQLVEKVEFISRQNLLLQEARRAMSKVVQELQTDKARIAEEQAKDQAMLASIGDGVAITDAEGKVVMLNQSAERLLGWTVAEAIGQRYDQVAPLVDDRGREVPLLERHFYQSLQTGAVTSLPVIASRSFYRRRDGTKFPMAGITTPIHLHHRIIGAITVFRDITQEKAVDRAKTEFVSLVSHQLRTPISSINWLTELLLTGEIGRLTRDQRQVVGEIASASHRVIEMVTTFLNATRLELGTLVVEPEPVDVSRLVTSIFQELEPVVKHKRLQMEQRQVGPGTPVPADPTLMRIIVQNLLTNAVVYSRPGGKVRVTVTNRSPQARPAPDAQGVMILEVADNGIGIPTEQQPQIFDKLFRADNARTAEPNGTGLGLYIVKSILDHVGGTISFTSPAGRGTTFTVTLPLSGMKRQAGTKPLQISPRKQVSLDTSNKKPRSPRSPIESGRGDRRQPVGIRR